MHCPTCGQNYPEGSQRFCDVDGSRLISSSDDDYRRGKQQVFSSILSASVPNSSPEDAKPEPLFVFTEQDEKEIDHQMDSLFFVEDEDERFADASKGEFEIIDEPEPVRNFGRRIDSHDIPAGHVEVGERDHPSINNTEFDVRDPEAFVGRAVKGRYHIIEFIGEEDTGFAYLAEDRIIAEKRVIVRILTGEDLDEITKSIFAEERVALSHMTHPNVVRLIDSGEFVDGTTFLISEHDEALTVDDILQIHGPLTVTRTARVIRQAAYALSDVHQDGVLHRDLRPQFLLVSHTERGAEIVKISNFGVSDGEPNDENLAYKSPEILDGRIPTIASDIYSLGVIAYQTLTGLTPFKSDSVKELLRRQRAGLRVHPADLRRDVIPAVDYVFDKALAADPLRRYPTAREFGDALFTALTAVPDLSDADNRVEVSTRDIHESQVPDALISGESSGTSEDSSDASLAGASGEPAWVRRSMEVPPDPGTSWIRFAAIGAFALVLIAAGAWYFLIGRTTGSETANNQTVTGNNSSESLPDNKADGGVPPSARIIEQPPNTKSFQNSRVNLKGDLYRNFVPFSLFFPNDWKATGPQESSDNKTRGKFLDIAGNTPDGKLKEQMLVSYYNSSGTYTEDTARFPEMVRETNETLKKLIPNYQMVSEGEIKLNDGWRAYEIKFQGSNVGDNGPRMIVWGRRIFIPVARPGVRSGFEITMLATNNSDQVHSVDDIGTTGELKSILATFEPGTSY